MNKISINNTPKNKTEVTKEFMVNYVDNKCNAEEKTEFANIWKDCAKGEKFDISKMRKYFIDKYFPALNKEKPKTESQKLNDKVLSWLN